jgi:hypothetical protein
MSEPVNEPTDDDVADGTQLPDDAAAELDEEGDAGVNDTGDEPWYDEDGTDG